MEPKRLLVTGCGRSGTVWMTRMLQAHGYQAGHEIAGTQNRDWGGIDVSWLAAAFPHKGYPIIHLVRNPLEVARSMFGRTIFQKPGHTWDRFIYSQYTSKYDDPRNQSLEYWLEWNRLVERHSPNVRVRLEDMNPNTFAQMLYFVGLKNDSRPKVGQNLWDGVGHPNASRNPEPTPDFSAYDPALVEEVISLAERYGYYSDGLNIYSRAPRDSESVESPPPDADAEGDG